MVSLSSFMLISLSIVYVFSYNYQRLENDHMCGATREILCITDELKIIAIIAQGILHKLDEIEKHIPKKVTAFERLDMNVNTEMNYTRSFIPVLNYHHKFFQHSNIDKEFLIKLLFESHDSMIYYYHSIKDLLTDKDTFAQETDISFKTIQDSIRIGMICQYRNLLHVYSQEWKLSHDIDRLRFSSADICPSCAHHVHSMVIARYLREWMTEIRNVTHNIEAKYA